MMDGLQSLQQWQTFMNSTPSAWLGFINAIQAVGGLITYPLQAYIADRFGRKMCLYLGLFFNVLGATLQTAATTQSMFIVARFFVSLILLCFLCWCLRQSPRHRFTPILKQRR